MQTAWYKRSGERITAARVAHAKTNYVQAKRTGQMGPMRCSIQLDIANRVEKMTLKEFANWSGVFTYRILH